MTPYFDAHNHLQDERFGGRQEVLLTEARAVGVVRMVVNGACESDWPEVARLAQRDACVLPSFGLHPWYVGERSDRWLEQLDHWLATVPGSVVGEIGLDRWMIENPDRWRRYRGEGHAFAGDPPDLESQEQVFAAQLALAARRNVPVSVHCLQAFGRVRDHLVRCRPDRGVLLHSYGGPVEMIGEFARLGAYFSFPGYFLHPRKARQREVFRLVPPDRLLVETDAPDQLSPDEYCGHPLSTDRGEPLNHPANLPRIYAGLAEALGWTSEALVAQVRENFLRLFGDGGGAGR